IATTEHPFPSGSQTVHSSQVSLKLCNNFPLLVPDTDGGADCSTVKEPVVCSGAGELLSVLEGSQHLSLGKHFALPAPKHLRVCRLGDFSGIFAENCSVTDFLTNGDTS